ncbi:hypothetical protein CC1G_11831 [Coprinopsis cinerea okayama7|uniref:Ribosomal RNA-processing protein 17 n=1 Tax=Coprinopsis cinerea (strain Okayama-7 / 130 / ATCC MYA-4618 / FGSC 9003) TaxID=240176 RepID=A8N5T3_COPC7|nr:hypothetical protein CC1G_11831 [Coprinopsis cinerea okayama7\|eukprot:XP_001830228.1 hypothetical protein CC1G_11831 [Coprinopsis cinerea okayama7\
MQTNIATLTKSYKAIAAKRKAKQNEVKEVLFDDEARKEFLTGFHKRKKAKIEAARQKAKEREKQERLEERRERRKELRERAIENAAQVEKAYRAQLGNDSEEEDDEWQGIGTSSAGKEQDEEYEGEQVVATVTVVEDFDPTTITTGPIPPQQPPEDDDTSDSPPRPTPSSSKPDSKPGLSKSRPKVNKVHYETKQARRFEREKQHKRKLEKAALAGSKAGRKQKSKSRR